MSDGPLVPGNPLPSPDPQQAEGLKAWGWVSYVLHLLVAVAAIIPGAQPSAVLLLIALVLDLVKRGDAAGTWQATHFSWRLSSVLVAVAHYPVLAWLLVPFTASVAVSRVVLGLHYPSDVLAATGIGGLLAGASLWLAQVTELGPP